jgi:arylformamidase
MPVHWHDVSIPIREGITVWPGDAGVKIEEGGRIARGGTSNTSRLHCGTHTGTHCDAPWHFEDDGKRLDEIDYQVFFGDALVIDHPHDHHVGLDDLPRNPLPPRLVFKTRNSSIPIDGMFREDYIGIEEEAARRMVDEGVRLVGIDYLSVAPYPAPEPTHHVLLGNEVFVVEGLRLAEVPAGTHPFVVLPMPLANADGAPCRAFVGLA